MTPLLTDGTHNSPFVIVSLGLCGSLTVDPHMTVIWEDEGIPGKQVKLWVRTVVGECHKQVLRADIMECEWVGAAVKK